MKRTLPFLLLAGTSLLFTTSSHAGLIASALTDSSDVNLVKHENDFQNYFSSATDIFQTISVSQLGAEQLIDRSALSPFIDNLGIITPDHLGSVFAASDTKNSDNTTGSVEALWVFDVSGFENLTLDIDIAAMGDFESSDRLSIYYQVNGTPQTTLWTAQAQTSRQQNYQLSSGQSVSLDDPLAIDGDLLSNQFTTFSADIAEKGQQLTIGIQASLDGGSEGVILKSMLISGDKQTQGPVTVPTPPSIILFLLAVLLARFHFYRITK